MIRKIKFRGKTFGNMWAYGFLSKHNKIYIANINCSPFDCKVQSETIGQFTNLVAKNVEVYENDILSLKIDFEKTYGIVRFVDDGWAIVDSSNEYIIGLWDGVYNCDAQIIGNMFEINKINIEDVKRALKISPERMEEIVKRARKM